MSMTVPPAVFWMFRILVGEDWPTGDEDLMFDLAKDWDKLEKALEGIEGEIGTITGKLPDAGAGPAMDQAIGLLNKITASTAEDGGEGYFPSLRDAATDLANTVRDTAADIQSTKLVILGLVIQVSYDYLKLAWMFAFGP